MSNFLKQELSTFNSEMWNHLKLKTLSRPEVVILYFLKLYTATEKKKGEPGPILTCDEVKATFNIRKIRMKQIITRLTKAGYIIPIYQVIDYRNEEYELFKDYKKAQKYQSSVGGVVLLYGLRLVSC